jgi:thiamine-phosphate pyrophosphorylase
VILPAPPVLVITDRQQARIPLEEVAEALFAGGCRWLSLREKDMPAVERLALLRRLVALGARWQASVMIHDDLDAAAEADAAGVHLPADGSPTEARRRLCGAALIGQSAHGADDVTRAAGAGVDYVTLSPVFITASKPGYGPPLGLDILGRKWPIPVLALGGIDEMNASACVRSGASGIAVMGEAMRAEDPRAFMAGLLARMRANLAPHRGPSHS